MEKRHEISVTSLDSAHRRALEDMIGTSLQQNQHLLISVTEVNMTPEAAAPRTQSIQDWTGVYDGLTDKEKEAIDRDVKQRADLHRSKP